MFVGPGIAKESKAEWPSPHPQAHSLVVPGPPYLLGGLVLADIRHALERPSGAILRPSSALIRLLSGLIKPLVTRIWLLRVVWWPLRALMTPYGPDES